MLSTDTLWTLPSADSNLFSSDVEIVIYNTSVKNGRGYVCVTRTKHACHLHFEQCLYRPVFNVSGLYKLRFFFVIRI